MNLATSNVMRRKHPIEHLASLQSRLIAITGRFNDRDYRRQFYSDTSPAGWHLGHTVFVENFWIHETILGKPSSPATRQLYLPENSPRSCRGEQLPSKKELLDSNAKRQQENLILLQGPPRELRDHTLMKNNYLVLFLAQHHAMHLETLYMIMTERNLRNNYRDYRPTQKLSARKIVRASDSFTGGQYRVGMQKPECFDNEMPPFECNLPDFSIQKTPVSNAEFLGFIHAGGYYNSHYWSTTGWQWRIQTKVCAPHHWRANDAGDWFGINDTGPYTLLPDAPVYGISYYEAEAFAEWAKARLPHEHEIEVAQRSGNMPVTTTVWEWCRNTFHPYAGFKPFPYERYSTPWFDHRHFVLKGGSHHTDKILKRPSIRNFYTAEKRHIFSGLRLAFDK